MNDLPLPENIIQARERLITMLREFDTADGTQFYRISCVWDIFHALTQCFQRTSYAAEQLEKAENQQKLVLANLPTVAKFAVKAKQVSEDTGLALSAVYDTLKQLKADDKVGSRTQPKEKAQRYWKLS